MDSSRNDTPGRALASSAAAAALLLLLSAPLACFASPAAGPPPMSAEEGPRFVCLGVLDGGGEKARFAPNDLRPVPHESLPLLLDRTVSAADSIYVVGLHRTVYPYMEKVLGHPVGIDTLVIVIDSTLNWGAYSSGRAIVMPGIGRGLFADSDGDGSVDEDGYDGIDNDGDGRIDEDPDTSPSWDNMFIHETTHAFQQGLMRSGLVATWLIEAFAVANEWFVAREAARDGCLRPLRTAEGGAATASLDMVDQAGAQVLGGGGRLIERVESWTCYRNAGAVLLVSGIAQGLASGSSTHPIRRLAAELEKEGRDPGVRDLWAALDRAWGAPIDGVFPPSRWIRARPVACPDVREGSFLALFASGLNGGLNPPSLRLLHFDRRRFSRFEIRDCFRAVLFTNTRGETLRAAPRSNLVHLRELSLAPGAYLVEAEETGSDGRELRARNWILMTPSGDALPVESGRTAVVFVGPDGFPFDPPNLRTNGRVVERVPGGAVIELPGGGTLSLGSGDRFLGAVTVPEPLPRMALVRAGCDGGEGVVAWSPYRCAPGEPIEVSIRRGESALDPDETDVLLRLRAGRRSPPSYFPLHPSGEDPDLLTARFLLPEDAPFVAFAFLAGRSSHENWSDSEGLLVSYGMRLDGSRGSRLLSARVEGDRLVLVFEEWTNPSRLRLLRSPGPGREWIERPDPPEPLDPGSKVLAWILHGRIDDEERFEVWERAYAEERLLAALDGGGRRSETGDVSCSLPLPNPSRAAVRWSIRAVNEATVRFAVYDASGRRVDGPEEVRLSAGTNEITWDGRSRGRDLPSGVYFLRLSAPGFDESRRAVLLRDR
ncbi:MAG: hypothetical protein ABIH26_04980 [Candidatus Eisenbacteria bacterium]